MSHATSRSIAATVRQLRSPRSRYSPNISPRLPCLSANHSSRSIAHDFALNGSRRCLSTTLPWRSGAASNPPMAFPCLDALESRSAKLEEETSNSNEPSYTSGATLNYLCKEPLLLDWGGILPEFNIAYETWGTLNSERSNAILLHTGLSASSHAHSTEANPQPGWWEKFIGPGKPLDTNKYFVICTNVIGGCYGSTGPGEVDPGNGERYATRFPILTIDDMVRAQFRLLDHLSIPSLYASVGSSMGGMQSLAAGSLFPDRVRRIVSISGCARSHPYSIAMRHTQRQVLMMDPNWNRGFYYSKVPPHAGMKLAREIATQTPALCPDFLIETYLDHAGEKWCLTFDPNSFLYVSKAMDLFDLGRDAQRETAARRGQREQQLLRSGEPASSFAADASCSLTLPSKPYEEQPELRATPEDLIKGLAPLRDTPTLVMGVASDILFPAWQQREVAEALRLAGNRNVTHIELSEEMSLFGHDTFLLDLKNIGGNLQRFLD
uniref:AB hydrolase-1 domain-containing protein n=1 Tax=Bionectria ochroleuca TaxID=29856 RepID=A0A8H7NJX4_BIOOC